VKYDTLIIGAGLSGLAAGIRLAYYGQSVCILERHTTIGGLNSFYRLRGRNYDVGLHAVTNYAPPGTKTGPLSKLLRQLRLSWDDFRLCPQIGSSVVFPGCTLRFTNDFEFFEQQIAERFPSQIDGLRRLVRRMNEHELRLDAPPLSARAIVADYLSDPLLTEMLFCPLLFYGSATPNDVDWEQFVILFRSIFQEGFGRPHEGVRRILRVLTRKYKAVGGELRLRSGVRSIQVQDGRAVGVVLDNGEQLEARNVLSSAGLPETLRLCPNGEERLPQAPPGELSFFESIFVLDCLPAELGHQETVVFYNDSAMFHYQAPSEPVDIRSGIICSPNNFRYDEPLEEGRVRMTALASPRYWMTLAEDRYATEKETCCQRIAEAAVRVMPDFRPHVVETDAFTPRTIRKYTGHVNGAVYGAPQKVLNGRTHVENLYLCGTDQGYLGITGAMMSGISIANAYLLK
jgi:phytoene dehydrogenase-like protein